jgi:hypothetical protein
MGVRRQETGDRSRKSRARSQNGGGVRAEQTADFFGNGGEMGGVSVSQILRQLS